MGKPKTPVIIGTRFNSLTILKEVPNILVGKESRRAVEVECDCGTIFTVRYSNLVTGNTKTCGCSTKYVTSSNRKLALERAIEGSTIRTTTSSAITSGCQKIEFICNVCDRAFLREFNVIIKRTSNCPHCTGTYSPGEDFYVESLKNALKDSCLTFIAKHDKDESLTSRSLVQLSCLECGATIKRKINQILTRSNYCHCNRKGGFDPTRPSTLYLLELRNSHEEVMGYKYGITNSTERRHKQIAKSLNGTAIPWIFWEYESGFVAKDHESFLKKIFKPVLNKDTMPDGWTETFDSNLLGQFLLLQSQQYGEF